MLRCLGGLLSLRISLVGFSAGVRPSFDSYIPSIHFPGRIGWGFTSDVVPLKPTGICGRAVSG